MKHKHLFAYIIISMMVYSCQKQLPATQSNSQPNQFIDSARRFLTEAVDTADHLRLNTAAPNLTKYDGQDIAVRIFEKNANPGKFILLFRKSGAFSGHWVDMTGLKKTVSDKYIGTVSISDLSNRLIAQYTIKDNQVTSIFDPSQARNTDVHTGPQTSMSTPDNPHTLDPYVVTPNGGSKYYSGYWLFGMDGGYNSTYVNEFDQEVQDLSGSQVTESIMEVAPTFPSPKHPIKDIKEELKCFTIDPKATYSVTVNVNQPKPHTRKLMSSNNDHEVGHTYLTLKEQLPNGESIIRNVGFYPKHDAKPGNSVDESTFGDDSETPHCVSLNIPLTSSEFSKMQENLYAQQNLKYDLNNHNCTTSAITTFTSFDSYLPSTIGNNAVFKGNNPADLAQDIREMNLKIFSTSNGGKQIIRTLRDNNTGFPPVRTKDCK